MLQELLLSWKLFKIKNLPVFLFPRTEFALDHDVLWHFLVSARMRKFSNPSWCEWIHLLLISLSTKIDSSQVLLNLHLTFNSNVSTPTQCSETALYQINFLLLLLKPSSHLRHLAYAKIICDLLGHWKTISIYALVKCFRKSAHICLLKRGGTEI